MQWPTEKAEWEQRTLPKLLRDYRFSHEWRVYFFLLTLLVFFNETSLYLGPEDIFIAFTGICYPLWEWVAWVACLLMSILFFVIKRLFFFAIIFGLVAILFGVFQPEKPFFIIGEEENFLDSLFLFEDEALLIVDVELQVIVNLWIHPSCWTMLSHWNVMINWGGGMKTGSYITCSNIFAS